MRLDDSRIAIRIGSAGRGTQITMRLQRTEATQGVQVPPLRVDVFSQLGLTVEPSRRACRRRFVQALEHGRNVHHCDSSPCIAGHRAAPLLSRKFEWFQFCLASRIEVLRVGRARDQTHSITQVVNLLRFAVMNTTRQREHGDGHPVDLGDEWILCKREKVTRWTLVTHRVGWELRLMTTDLLRSQPWRSSDDILKQSGTVETRNARERLGVTSSGQSRARYPTCNINVTNFGWVSSSPYLSLWLLKD